MKKWKYICLALILIIGFAVGCFYGVPVYMHKTVEQYMVSVASSPNCDAIMVLGALVYQNGTPSPVLEDRLLYALELYQAGKAEKIIVSGDHGQANYDEVNVMKAYLMDKGVPRTDIFMDHAGFDTFDSMVRAKEIFQVKSLLVSTQEFHMSRALYIARRIGIDAYGYPSPDKEIYSMQKLNFREKLASLKAVLDTDILRREPKFGGEAIPIWKDGALTDG